MLERTCGLLGSHLGTSQVGWQKKCSPRVCHFHWDAVAILGLTVMCFAFCPCNDDNIPVTVTIRLSPLITKRPWSGGDFLSIENYCMSTKYLWECFNLYLWISVDHQKAIYIWVDRLASYGGGKIAVPSTAPHPPTRQERRNWQGR